MNKSILTVILFSISSIVFSQKIIVTYYDSTWLLTTKTYAKYFRTGIIDNKYKYYGEVKDYYMNGQLQMKGKFHANIKEDTFYFYYPTGALMTKGAYRNNLRYGMWTSFYENGRIKDKVFFNGEFICALEYYDEKGTPKMVKGTGVWETEYYSDLVEGIMTIQGEYKDTLRQGVWRSYIKSFVTGFSHEKRLECVEEFDHGKFVKGRYYSLAFGSEEIGRSAMIILPETKKFKKLENWSTTRLASIDEYPKLKFLHKVDSSLFPVDELAEFPAGLDVLTSLFQENLNLTKSYIDYQKINSVTLLLMVSENGHLKVKDISGMPNFSPDQEEFNNRLINTIKKLPDWRPAIRNGKKVKSNVRLDVKMVYGRIRIELLSQW
jgi:antitoxin component YwqK of YwqJK toxin-antitoxin module